MHARRKELLGHDVFTAFTSSTILPTVSEKAVAKTCRDKWQFCTSQVASRVSE